MNIMNPPADWSTLKKLIWLRGTPITGGEELTVSGTPPLSLPNSLGKPLKAWAVDLLPYQEGTGDPSPDNVRAIHGTDKVTIYTDSKYGGLINWNQIFPFDDDDTFGANGVTWTVKNGKVVSTGATTVSTLFSIFPARIYNTLKLIYNHKYYIHFDGNISINLRYVVYYTGYPAQSIVMDGTSQMFTVAHENCSDSEYIIPASVGTPVTGEFYTYLCDLTQMFGAGNEPTTVDEFRALFPNDYYAYNAGQQMTVDQVNGAQYSPAVLTLPQTVYTGTIGSEGGESRSTAIDMGSCTWSYSATYNRMSCSPIAEVKPPLGTEINAYCEMFKVVTANYGWTHRDTEQMIAIDESGYIRVYSPPYTDPAEFTSAVSGKKLICELATPTTFAVPSVTIPTPTGTATTWATAEDGTVDGMEVTYVGKA